MLSQLRLLWQKYLLKLMEMEFSASQYVIRILWANYPDGFYDHLDNGRKIKFHVKATKG
ncbi:hypothetical protein BTN49_1218 [Candidatus Enterovibrio escicola]|uniref:Uncharacterized protein n=1 Tax=Candidatus Enterovibrio escicola TaxID=1927127 RepID=A0A2A5T4Y3_9GAMM|nr:hypothetical protein BTN49_1218 [Candidatus Enterovibrio escacola]